MSREDLIQQITQCMAKCQRPASIAGWQKLGLSHAQVSMLYMLSYHKQLQSKQIAGFLGISKSAVSQLIEPLLDKNLVSRRSDLKDRRIAHLSLTVGGAEMLKKINKLKFAGLRSRLAELNDNELKQLSNICAKMAAAVVKI